jgi:hypothetical protein
MNSCVPCVDAGHALEVMKTRLLAEFPGKVKGYAFGFNNSQSCTVTNNWVNGNGFTSVPTDSGAVRVSYCGGFGMQTVVLREGGSNHSVLGAPYTKGFRDSDERHGRRVGRPASMAVTSISMDGTATAGISVNLHPHPVTGQLSLEIHSHWCCKPRLLTWHAGSPSRRMRILCRR